MVGPKRPKQTGHSGQREKTCKIPSFCILQAQFICQLPKLSRLITMSLFCTAVILFFAIHALGSLGKSSTPGVDHITGRSKPSQFLPERRGLRGGIGSS
ncbi:hypothetical protein BGAL_0489g00020 [Botrytis galanthina]|uniref:Transmembrane protein n=1 Tax=Botrytis galanthina TaxID=278940 RepID=A0A4S8QKF5_9HELO|nr:hypothetical protein BGAL_0489g00020 [Botrytis galanthina]